MCVERCNIYKLSRTDRRHYPSVKPQDHLWRARSRARSQCRSLRPTFKPHPSIVTSLGGGVMGLLRAAIIAPIWGGMECHLLWSHPWQSLVKSIGGGWSHPAWMPLALGSRQATAPEHALKVSSSSCGGTTDVQMGINAFTTDFRGHIMAWSRRNSPHMNGCQLQELQLHSLVLEHTPGLVQFAALTIALAAGGCWTPSTDTQARPPSSNSDRWLQHGPLRNKTNLYRY